jgi:uncharacterized membrane-anchored protein
LIQLPESHPQRFVLADEVHARPPEALETPQLATHLAVLLDPAQREAERAHLDAVCGRYGVEPPSSQSSHFSADFEAFRLRWERHGEFSTYTVLVKGMEDRPYGRPAISYLPADWLSAVPGRTIAAAHARLIAHPPGSLPDAETLAAHFGANVVVGSEIGEGVGLAYTDFRIRGDGFVRYLICDISMTPRQAGRMLQRLFEIETYRVMAMLALPIAQREAPRILNVERSLGRFTDSMGRDDSADETLLVELTSLAASIEGSLAASQFRFGASRAYYDLVRARIADLRERRLPGLQTIEEFMSRRLAPAIATCESVSRRLRELSERVTRASALLSTRVDIARSRQNQALLASMDRRARLQLRLQFAVEGLSVAAITYYVVGLVQYCARGLHAAGLAIDTDIVAAAAIPVVALLVAVAIRQVRRKIVSVEQGGA